MDHKYFGAYNGVCFKEGGTDVGQILDRSKRKEPVRFEERLTDISGEERQRSDFYIVSMSPKRPDTAGLNDHKKIRIGNDDFIVLDQDQRKQCADGFGISRLYQMVLTNDDTTSVILSIDIPNDCLYEIKWDALARTGNTFVLPGDIYLTVYGESDWKFTDSVFQLQAREPCTIRFLIESKAAAKPVSSTIIIANASNLKEAFVIRSLLGKHFVSCFTCDPGSGQETERIKEYIAKIRFEKVVSIGIPFIRSIVPDTVVIIDIPVAPFSELHVQELLNTSKNRRLLAPANAGYYGIALYMALMNDALLCFVEGQKSELLLTDTRGTILENWDAGELTNKKLGNAGSDQLVICESVSDDQLISQAIGFALAYDTAIAFIDRIDAAIPQGGLPDKSAGIDFLESVCDRAISEELRQPDVKGITVFTKEIPLHLTKYSNGPGAERIYWKDRYILSHLPGFTASLLTPWFYSAKNFSTVPYTIIFDALDVASEGAEFSSLVGNQLNLALLISGKYATGEFLKELLQRLETDLVLLITHGLNNFIEDYNGMEISAGEIMQWKMKTNPLVFNNSCASWVTTGEAFLSAGARAMVATLWPVYNKSALQMGLELGKKMNDEKSAMAELVHSTFTGATNLAEDQEAYFFVGLPFDALNAIRPADDRDVLQILVRCFIELDELSIRLLLEEKPALAEAIRDSMRKSVLTRFNLILEKHRLTIAYPLPVPFQSLTLLEIPYLFAASDFQFNEKLLFKIPSGKQQAHIRQMDSTLQFIIKELWTWEQRHREYKGQSETHEETHEFSFLNRSISPGKLYAMLFQTADRFVLSFIVTLVEFGFIDDAWHWLNAAALMVTTPEDVGPDNIVDDENVIRRMREGVIEEMVSLTGETMEFDHLQHFDRPELLNRFGICLFNLREYSRAAAFYEAALEMAEPGTSTYHNIFSNLTKARSFLQSNHDISAEYRKVIEEQLSAKNYSNAIISINNLGKYWLKQRLPAEEWFMGSAHMALDQLSLNEKKLRHCELLAIQACLNAAAGLYEEGEMISRKIADYLQPGFREATISCYLSEYGLYLYNEGYYRRSIEVCLWNEVAFTKMGLYDDVGRTLFLICSSAIQLYMGIKNAENSIRFVESAKRLGKILNQVPFLKEELRNNVESIENNLRFFWQESTERRQLQLARETYLALREWGDPVSPEGELLIAVCNPRNNEAVQIAARNKELTRKVTFSIDENAHLSIEKSTSLKIGPGSKTPKTLHCYWKVADENAIDFDRSTGKYCAKSVLFPVRNGETFSISEGPYSVYLYNHVYFYSDQWGSNIFDYNYFIESAPGIVPLQVFWEGEVKSIARSSILIDERGFHINILPDESNAPLNIGKLEIRFTQNNELWRIIKSTGLIFNRQIDLATFTTFMMLLLNHSKT